MTELRRGGRLLRAASDDPKKPDFTGPLRMQGWRRRRGADGAASLKRALWIKALGSRGVWLTASTYGLAGGVVQLMTIPISEGATNWVTALRIAAVLATTVVCGVLVGAGMQVQATAGKAVYLYN